MEQLEEKMWLLLRDIEDKVGTHDPIYAHAYDIYVDIYDIMKSQQKEQK